MRTFDTLPADFRLSVSYVARIARIDAPIEPDHPDVVTRGPRPHPSPAGAMNVYAPARYDERRVPPGRRPRAAFGRIRGSAADGRRRRAHGSGFHGRSTGGGDGCRARR